MSIASVLIPSDKPHGVATGSSTGPRYSLLLSTDPSMVEAAQRLRYDVFSTTPGFALPAAADTRRDGDRFDEYCDHLLVRDDDTGELVGCYRMLAPAGAIAAGGLYTATEFDVCAFDPLRPSLVEMGRAVVREGHRNGGVVLLMWAGILAYLDRYGYDYVTGCVSVPIGETVKRRAAGCVGCATSSSTGMPRRRSARCTPTGRCAWTGGPRRHSPSATASSSPLMRGYLRLGARPAGSRRTTRTLAWATSACYWIRTTPIRDICDDCGRLRRPRKW